MLASQLAMWGRLSVFRNGAVKQRQSLQCFFSYFHFLLSHQMSNSSETVLFCSFVYGLAARQIDMVPRASQPIRSRKRH